MISGILIGYCLLRLFGRFISGFCIPQKYTAAIAPTKLGLAFTSQAGVAMGMALVAANQFPQYRNEILTISISATVIFEILGPILTNVSLSYPKEKTR